MYLEHTFVHSGQNHDFELYEVFLKDLNIRKPDYFLDAAGENPAETIGKVIIKSDKIIGEVKPHAFLILGDTNSCLAAISAKRRRVPIFHMEAGNRCFDQRVPEEINRKIVDHISDINMTYTEHARRYLLQEGLRPETVIKTGSPMKEVISTYKSKIDISDILKQLDLEPEKYFVVSAHREENIDSEKNLSGLLRSIEALAEMHNLPIIFSAHPRTRNKLKSLPVGALNPRIRVMRPFCFSDYMKLQMHATCVISDSGTITEEASILDFPAVTIREAHERPEGMDEGTLIMCGLKPDMVLGSIEIVTKHFSRKKRVFNLVQDYDTEHVSKKVVRIIMSYTDYVNRTIWYKETV
jgi:UDP-N-acetylglucosamine 2-epimerase (non-hydrolysing)